MNSGRTTLNRRASARGLLGGLLLFTAAAALAADPVPVAVAMAGQERIFHEVLVNGTVTSPRVSRLSAQTSGLVVDITVDEGSRVAADAVLLRLDPELAELQLASARARAEQSRAALADAERRLGEARQLMSRQTIAESLVRDLEAEVTQDQAALQQAEAQAAYQRAVLQRHTVSAPFAGVVSAKLVENGEWVQPGEAILELVSLDGLRLDFPVAEDYLAGINEHTGIALSLNAAPENAMTPGAMTLVPVMDSGTRTFLLRVLLEHAAGPVIPGMSAQALLRLDAGRDGLVVPRDALLRFPDGRAVVWTVTAGPGDTVVQENNVEPGLAFSGRVEIRTGLAPGVRVVVRGNELLRPAQRVTVVDGGGD